MTDDDRWHIDAVTHGWQMPPWPLWKRIYPIRMIRALWASWHVESHNAAWRSLGMIPTGYDEWVVYGIARGFQREVPFPPKETSNA